jgi:hypothetical protein
MKAPLSEPGWEVLIGAEATEKWGDKNKEIHEMWDSDTDVWCEPSSGKSFASRIWYRRPCAVHPVMEHFI